MVIHLVQAGVSFLGDLKGVNKFSKSKLPEPNLLKYILVVLTRLRNDIV